LELFILPRASKKTFKKRRMESYFFGFPKALGLHPPHKNENKRGKAKMPLK